jgi:flagellar basal body-associated protein FliL
MSEKATEEAPKKKKGKLPIILVLVLVLAGGGFFVMKGKGKKAPPPVALAPTASIIEIKEDILVNLYGTETYLRCKIQLHPAKDAKKEHIEHALPLILDTIYARCRKTTLAGISSPEGLSLLKRQLCSDINWQLEKLEEATEPPKDDAKAEKEKKKGKKGKDEAADEENPDVMPEVSKLPKLEDLEHPDWDSDEGPILKIYFTSFASQ